MLDVQQWSTTATMSRPTKAICAQYDLTTPPVYEEQGDKITVLKQDSKAHFSDSEAVWVWTCTKVPSSTGAVYIKGSTFKEADRGKGS